MTEANEQPSEYSVLLDTVTHDEARELVGLALDRIEDENNVTLARQSVQFTFEGEAR